jgi:tetratricopeptide (TPR) repeat protein
MSQMTMTLEQAMQMASQHHQAGRLAVAEEIYRQILVHQPNHIEALHQLGVLAGQAGHPDKAIELIGRAIKLKPDFPEAYTNLACALAEKGQLDEAIAAFRRVIELRPKSAEAHHGLATVLRTNDQLDEAIAAYSWAIHLRPNYPQAKSDLGNVLRSKGRLDEAIALHSQAIALMPEFAEAHSNLGNALKEKELFEEAIAAYSKAVELKPDMPVFHFSLGEVLCAMGRSEEGVAAFRRAIELDPNYFDALNQLGITLAELERFDEALGAQRQAAALRPNDPISDQTLGLILMRRSDASGAEVSLRRALAASPDLVLSWNGLGTALKVLGQFEEASTCFRRALSLRSDSAMLYKNLSSTGRQVIDDTEVQRLTALLNRPTASVDERVAAGFALGKLLDEADRFDEAFEQYAQANKIYRDSKAERGERFDIDKLRQHVDETIRAFSPQLIKDRQGWGDASELPVFIVGMPRSGTTLVEQIAASHPDVFGAGELSDINQIARELGEGVEATQGWNSDSVKTAAKAHLEHLRTMGGSAIRVIDKMPDNVLKLGLIATLFPSARVIFCQRDPRDTCLSCYFQWFTATILFAYDLADCGRRYLEIERLAHYWRSVLPLKMLEVQYEELVADLEGQSRRLIDFLGLPWNPACLDFHKTKRTVMTASVWQVRQPIYSRSAGRWRQYERHLKPLLEVLGMPPSKSTAASSR